MRLFAMGAIVALLVFSTSAFGSDAEIPHGKLPLGATPTGYDLALTIVPAKDRFSGHARISVSLDRPTNRIWLHGQDLEVSQASIELASGLVVPALFSEVGETGVAKIDAVTAVGPGPVTLDIRYSAAFDQSLEGLYQVKKDGQVYAYTQFQPLSARLAFPGFDEPRFKTPFTIRLTVPQGLTAVSNAPVSAERDIGDGMKEVAFQETAPIPTYLVAMAVGDFDVVEWRAIPPNDVRSRPIPLRGIAPKGKGEKLRYALSNTEALLAILEEYFGSEYPYAKLDLVAAAEFKAWGMENVGAIFYREDHLLLDDDPSIYQKRGYAYLHAHELAHSWFGNLVTPAWWDDLWLNEAFATWMSDYAVSRWNPNDYDNRGGIRRGNRAKWSDRLISARQIRQPIESNHDIASAFDSITYSKGGSVLAMVERYMTPDVFRNGVRRFMAKHRHGVATSRDFFTALSETARDPGILRAFRSFLDQPGTPRVAVAWSCSAGGGATAELRQSRSLPLGSAGIGRRTWSLPMCVSYGDDETTHSQCTLMETASATLPLPMSGCPTWVHPNSAGAAYLNFDFPEGGWDALIRRLADMPAPEALAAMSSLQAAYESGRADSDTVLRAAEILAQSPHWDVASAPFQVLRDIKNFILPRGEREDFKRLMQEIYRPAIARFDLSDAALARSASDTDQALLRGDLIWFMAVDAEEPALRRQLTRLAVAYLGGDDFGRIDSSVLHPNLHRVALVAAAGEAGLPFVRKLAGLMRTSSDATLREHALRALAHQTDPESAAWLRDLMMDPETSRYDASQLLRYQARRADNGPAIFAWLKEHYDAYTNRIPRSHVAWMPWRVFAVCERSARNDIAAFFETRVQDHRGGPRALRNVLEAIDICVAYSEAQREDALAALARRRS